MEFTETFFAEKAGKRLHAFTAISLCLRVPVGLLSYNYFLNHFFAELFIHQFNDLFFLINQFIF
jgi:hypothetical protein